MFIPVAYGDLLIIMAASFFLPKLGVNSLHAW